MTVSLAALLTLTRRSSLSQIRLAMLEQALRWERAFLSVTMLLVAVIVAFCAKSERFAHRLVTQSATSAPALPWGQASPLVTSVYQLA
jgi:hypothetical protein